MPEPGNPAGPEEQPVIAGADDVDRLLAEAQSLADQIAAGTGTTQAADQPSATRGDERAEAKDALAATSEVEKTLAELEGMLGSGATAEQPANAENAKKTSAVSEEVKPAANAQSPPPSRGRNKILNASIEAQIADGVDVDLGDGALAGSAEAGKAGLARSDKHTEKRSPRAVLAGMQTAGRRVGVAVLRFPPKMVMKVADLLDLPFAGLSPAVKKHIGIAAMVTVIAAIASFVMPPLFARNPYIKLAEPPEASASEKEGNAKGKEGKETKKEGNGAEKEGKPAEKEGQAPEKEVKPPAKESKPPAKEGHAAAKKGHAKGRE
jgi:hypothetical protein